MDNVTLALTMAIFFVGIGLAFLIRRAFNSSQKLLLGVLVFSLAVNAYFLLGRNLEILAEIKRFRVTHNGVNLQSKIGTNGTLNLEEMEAKMDFYKVMYFIRYSGMEFLYGDFVRKTDSTSYQHERARTLPSFSEGP